MDEEAAKAALRVENEEFMELETEHARLEDALDEMNRRKHLTAEEEMERKTLQKKKLIKKDRMAQLVRERMDA